MRVNRASLGSRLKELAEGGYGKVYTNAERLRYFAWRLSRLIAFKEFTNCQVAEQAQVAAPTQSRSATLAQPWGPGRPRPLQRYGRGLSSSNGCHRRPSC